MRRSKPDGHHEGSKKIIRNQARNALIAAREGKKWLAWGFQLPSPPPVIFVGFFLVSLRSSLFFNIIIIFSNKPSRCAVFLLFNSYRDPAGMKTEKEKKTRKNTRCLLRWRTAATRTTATPTRAGRTGKRTYTNTARTKEIKFASTYAPIADPSEPYLITRTA